MSSPAETEAVRNARLRYDSAIRAVAVLPELEALAGARVCIAGFTGQVGSALVRVLVEANRTTLAASPAQLTGIARSRREPTPEGVEVVYADVADRSAAISPDRFTHVFYAVGVTSDYRLRPSDVLATQLVGLEALLERVDPDCTFVFVSSARVYGRRAVDETLHEDTAAIVAPMHLDNLYDSAKRLAESLCLWHAERRGLNIVVARAGNLYGLDSSRSETAVSALVRDAVSTGRITLTGDPASMRNYCCSVDFVQGLLRAAGLGRRGTAYNIGSDEHLTTQELARAIEECFDVPVETVRVPDATPISFQRLSIDRARAELSYAPQLAIRDVLSAIVAEIAAESAAHGVALPTEIV